MIFEIDLIAQKKSRFQRTITSEGAEGDVLLSGGGSLLGSHCECVDGGCRGWNMEEKKEKFAKLKIEKVGVCPRVLLHGDWPEKSGKRVDRSYGLRHECGSKVGLWAVRGSAPLAYLNFSLLFPTLLPINANCSSHSSSTQWKAEVIRPKHTLSFSTNYQCTFRESRHHCATTTLRA
jgi:hypothetical protein